MWSGCTREMPKWLNLCHTCHWNKGRFIQGWPNGNFILKLHEEYKANTITIVCIPQTKQSLWKKKIRKKTATLQKMVFWIYVIFGSFSIWHIYFWFANPLLEECCSEATLISTCTPSSYI
jgi:hypothetical protein